MVIELKKPAEPRSDDLFASWGIIFYRLSLIAAGGCLLSVLGFALTANEPIFSRLLSIVVLGVLPASLIIMLGAICRAGFELLSWCYRKSQPAMVKLETTLLHWVNFTATKCRGIKQFDRWLLLVVTAPIRAAARFVTAIAPSLA